MKQKLFMKVLMSESDRIKLPDAPYIVPMELLSEDNAKRFHQQSLRTLNGRGGLTVQEILANIKGDDSVLKEDSVEAVNELLKLLSK